MSEAAGVELGKAYLSLVASTRDFKASLKPAFNELDIETGKATQKSSKSLLAGVGGAIGRVAKVGALGIAGLGTAVVGLAAKGGISRALAIEDAQAKLKGLGHDTKTIDQIMSDALKSVKGTSFGLGDAATAAAGAVASGVKPGKDLERTLKLIGDGATIAGVSFGDMAAIFNKAGASNKVQGEILAQLGDAGIPIVQLLGKSMGKTADEIYDMSRDGAINFAMFQDAMEQGMGGAALSSGKTFRGAWQNVMAALGRGGETVIKPVLDLLRDGFNAAIPVIDSAVAAIKPFMASFTEKAPDVIAGIREGFSKFWDILTTKIIPALQEVVGWFKENKAWIEPLTVAILAGWAAWTLYNLVTGAYASIGAKITGILKGQTVAQWLLNAAMAANPIGLVITAVAALVAGFIYLWNTNEGFRNFFIGAWEGIKTAIGVVGEFIGGVFAAIGAWINTSLVPAFQWLWTGVIQPVWTAIQSAIAAAWSFIQPIFAAIGNFVTAVFGPVFTWLYETIIKPIWAAISFAIDVAYNVIKLAFDLTVYAIKNVLGPMFVWLYENVIKPVWANIKGAISLAWSVIKVIFNAVVGFVRDTLGAIFTWLYNTIIKPVWDGIKWYITTSWAGMKIVFNAIKGFIEKTLGPVFTWIYEKVIKPVWDGIKSTVSRVWEKGIKPIFEALGSFIKTNVAPAFEEGVKIIKGFWEGLKAIALAPVNFIIGTVYNKGIVGTFNNVAKAIGSKAHLNTLPLVGGSASSNPAQGRGFGGTKVQARAKGGYTPRGWTLVGEEGPELVNFASPGMVYTAAQTKLMQAGQQQAPMGALSSLAGSSPAQSKLPAGGLLSDAAGNLGGLLKTAWSAASGWVRGKFADALQSTLLPLYNGLTGWMGNSGLTGLVRDGGSHIISELIKKARGEDATVAKELAAGGGAAGSYDGPLGRFHRPSAGPYTSMYGPRWGRFHAGVDIAGGGKTYAALNGLVKFIGKGGGLPGRTGHGIRLDHGGGFQTYYGHNPYNGVQVKVGQRVKAGQHIGYQGATGNVTGVHLHFETLKNGQAVNPMAYLHDSGGWHAPGTLSYNGLKEPEAVLTPSQWDTAERALSESQSGFIGSTRIVLEDGTELRAYIERTSDARLERHVANLRQPKRQMTGK